MKISFIVCGSLCGLLLLLSQPYLCGFRRSGVLKNSNAAAFHSRIGNVDEGPGFACCQSVGTTPLGTQIAFVFSLFFGFSSLVIAAVCYLDKIIGIVINISVICDKFFDLGIGFIFKLQTKTED